MADLKGKMAHIKNAIYKAGNTGLLVLPLLLMDIYVRVLASRINYSRAEMYFPSIMFSVVWISAIVWVSVFSGSKLGRALYFSFFLLFFAFANGKPNQEAHVCQRQNKHNPTVKRTDYTVKRTQKDYQHASTKQDGEVEF